MKEPRHDDERLAALLEGRLEGPERDELLAYLAVADEDFYVFARTAAALREMEEQEAAQAPQAPEHTGNPPVRETIPPSARQGWRRWKAPQVIVSAVLAGLVVLVPFLRPPPPPGLLHVAANLEQAQQGVPEGWPQPNWPNTARGDGSNPNSDGEKTAARAGATLMDLTVAARAGNAEATRRFAQRAASFDPGGAGALQEIQARAEESYDDLEPLLQRATERLEVLLDRDHLRLGAWAEAARLAAFRRDAAFFRSDDTRAMLRRAERLTRDDSAAQGALSRIRAAAPGEGALDWSALTTGTEELLKEIGS